MADSSRRGFQGAGLFSKHTSSVFTFAKPLSILLLASGLLACGGGGGSSSSSGSIAACSGADFTATQYEAGDSAELITKKSLSQIYLMQGSDALPLESTPSDMGYFITVPMTPDLAANGGTVSYEAELDGKRCALPSLDVTPLPQADDDSYGDMLDAMELVVSNLETMLAYDANAITQGEINSDPLMLFAHWIHEVFTDPNSELSPTYQRNLMASFSDADKQYFAQIIEKLDLSNSLQNLAQDFDQSLFNVNIQPKAIRLANARTAREPATLHAQSCTNRFNDSSRYKVDIYDAASLSIGMKLAYQAQEKINNAQANAAAAARKGTAVNVLSTAGSLAKGGAYAGPLAALGAIAGYASFENDVGNAQMAKLLPSKISRTDLQIIPKAQLEEDYTEKFSNPSWTFSVNASSESYNLSKQIADLALNALGASQLPVDAQVMAGFTEVSNRVIADANATDCDLIVPAITWRNIPIDAEHAEVTLLSGSAFELDNSNKKVLKPVAIGESELEVKLKPDSYPSFSNTLAQQRATQKIENLQKTITFGSNPIIVNNPGEVIDIEVLIKNSVSPEKFLVDHSVGVLASSSRSGNIVTLSIDTPNDTSKYPQSITVASTSMSLLPNGDRKTFAAIELKGLEIEIEEIQSGFCDSGTYIEVNNAKVSGEKTDDSVTWTASGGTIVTLLDNHIRFEAQQPGEYTLTATSNEDSNVSKSVVITAGNCSSNMFMHGKVTTNAESPDVSGNCPVNNPDDTEEVTAYGKEVDTFININPTNIRSKMSTFGPGQAINFNQSDSGTYAHSYEINETCYTKQIDLIASSSGQVSSVGDGRVNFNTEHTTKGDCYASQESDGSNTTLCTLAGAGETYQIIWMFDHKQARSYNVVNALSCTAPPVNYPQGFPTSPDMVYQLLMYDENNQFVDPSLMTTQPAFSTNCRAGSPPSGHSFDVPEMPEGYHVMILLSMAYPVGKLPDLSGGNNPGATSLPASGKITGYIQVQPQ